MGVLTYIGTLFRFGCFTFHGTLGDCECLKVGGTLSRYGCFGNHGTFKVEGASAFL